MCRLEASGKDEAVDRSLWKSTLCGSRSKSRGHGLEHWIGLIPASTCQLNSTGGYHAEPIDVWGAGVVLFTLLAGSKCTLNRARTNATVLKVASLQIRLGMSHRQRVRNTKRTCQESYCNTNLGVIFHQMRYVSDLCTETAIG